MPANLQRDFVVEVLNCSRYEDDFFHDFFYAYKAELICKCVSAGLIGKAILFGIKKLEGENVGVYS